MIGSLLTRRAFLLALAITSALSVHTRAEAPSVQPWQRLDGCRLKASPWNDGDSFHVQCQGKEYLFRLYFVDTPEAESSYADRTAEQAAYFRITGPQAVALGKQAAAFTRQQLGGQSFTVWTHWGDAMGRSQMKRFYAIVQVKGQDLGELLVRNGFARIYGSRVPLPDGRDSKAYLAKLTELEATAKNLKAGGWKK